MKVLDSFLLALTFLTRFPIAIKQETDERHFNRSTIFFPLVGALVGALAALAYLGLMALFPRNVTIVLVMLVPIFISGGIHFDGLMDAADGLFSGRPRERALEIMRDSRVGSMGVIAGVFSVILRYSILLEMPAELLAISLVAMPLTGRWGITLALHFFPYARPEGGLGKAFTAQKNSLTPILGTLLALTLLALLQGWVGLVAGLLAILLSLLIASWANRQLGGLTGDVYGALNETTEIIFLLGYLLLTTKMSQLF
jgi:adenosylcobinamide-GDP ribazoletransferase